MLDALEARLGQAIRGTVSGTLAWLVETLAWLVEYASVLRNRYVVSVDGKTSYESLRGKKLRMFGL